MNKMRFFLILVLFSLPGYELTFPAQSMADTVRYVAPSGACTSMPTCYATVQAAIDAADSGDVIEIATGTYTDMASPNGFAEAAYITKDLTLRGGYSADFTTQDPKTYPTTLNAGRAGRVLYIDGSAAATLITVTLDGLELTGGYWGASRWYAYNDAPEGSMVSNSWWRAPAGGGVYARKANVVFLNSRLYDNHTPNGIGSGLFQQHGAFTMSNSTVENNGGEGRNWPSLGECGGGLFLLQTTARISNSSILNNSTGYGTDSSMAHGGGIFLNHSTASIDHTTIQGNVAARYTTGRGGGIYAEWGSVTLSNSTVASNNAAQVETYYGQQGGGMYVSGTEGTTVITNNLFQGNTRGGLVVYYGAMMIKGNTFTGNTLSSNAIRGGGGVYLSGTGTFQNNVVTSNSVVGDGGGGMFGGSVTVTGNRFEGNTATGGGGGLAANDTVTLSRNLIQNNSSGNCGGGVASNGLALEDGDLLLNNTAWYGGGLCIRGNKSSAAYQNLVILNNTGSVNGSGVYVDRGSVSGTVNLRHLTIGKNIGGDLSGVYFNTGNATFTNTIIYDQAVGVQNLSGNPTFNHTLFYQVTTPTVGAVSNNYALTGNPSFTADGYHLTQQSAAIDQGASTSVTDDVDGGTRPQGAAPDLGAVESPYTRNVPMGVQAGLQAGTPHWVLQWDPVSNGTTFTLQQDYLVQYSYGGASADPAINSFSIHNNLPTALELSSQETTPAMTFSKTGNRLTWNSITPLLPGGSGWVGILGQSTSIVPGANLDSTGEMDYLTNTIPLQASSTVPDKPLLPPMLTYPFPGEMCLDEQGHLQASGITYANMTVNLYENSALKATTTADASGKFALDWTSTMTDSDPVNLTATVCDPANPGNCSAPSRAIHLAMPTAFWCPQRSTWEGDVGSTHYVFHFVNDQGHYATNDIMMPGVYGFRGTQLHLYSCCDMETNPFTVKADGVKYSPTGHEGRMWTFTIGSAHDFTVQSQCQVGGDKPSHGTILIDPDGFVFDSADGGGYDAVTGMFAPVTPISGITVTAYYYEPDWNSWIVWPASLYNNQVNPQVTGPDGYFAFFTPPGQYYLQATAANGYQSWRSPVITVVTEVVHQNIPLTSWRDNQVSRVTLTPYGPSLSTVHIPPGGTVEWITSLGYSPTVSKLASLTENPVQRILSGLDPLTNTLGFDGGMQIPGQVYRRQFNQEGTYDYTDGAGHYGRVNVAYNNTTPDQFTFIDQTNVALSTVIISNTITVTGITAGVPISITGGEYSVSTDGGSNWSAYSSSTPSTVSLNNQVKVRQTSSASHSAATDATLTIGGVSDTFSATTAAASTATTNTATGITATGATLNGTVNANNASTTVTFEYGLTAAYGSTVTADQSPVTGNSDTAVSKAITGLTPNTTYHYRVVGVNSDGTTNGSDLTFTTTGLSPTVATVVTTAATSITTNGATLNGTVNANGASATVTFEYGLTTAYGSTITATQSPVTGTSVTPVSGLVTGLSPNTLYHVRAYAINSAGTAYGNDVQFTTASLATVTFPAATGNGNITLTTNSPGCVFTTFGANTEAQVGNDPSYDYPYGLVTFTLNCANADVTITFPGNITGIPYRRYGPTTPGDAATTQWYTFNNVTSNGSNSIILHLTDGQLGDDTGVDGIIVDAGGPAQQQTTAIPTLNEWGMITFIVFIGIVSVLYLRRRRLLR